MNRSAARCVLCILTVTLVAACGGTREATQRSDRSMAPGSLVAPQSEQWDTPASLLSGKTPAYPISLFVTGKTGYAEVTFTVAQDGSTRDIKVIEADQPAFGDHLAIAVRNWRFEPARKNGLAIASSLNYGLCFEIERNFTVPPSPHDSKRCNK